eukprot:2581446-Amphidinium_carterae.1
MATLCYTMVCGSSYNVPLAVLQEAKCDNNARERISPNRQCYFDLVAKLARAIVNRANQFWETIVLVHRWVLHHADNDSDSKDVVVMTNTIPSESSSTLRIYRDNDNTSGMFGKMSVKLPTQRDGKTHNSENGQVRSTLT